MKDKILISVIMPAYNAMNTINEAIHSVLRQTYKNWELILIDDCSKDSTYEIAERFSKADPRIAVIQNKENLGVSITRNTGIAQANGSWIAFLDSDDIWRDDKLEKQVKIIEERKDADFIYTGSTFIDMAGNAVCYSLPVPEQVTYQMMLKQNLISCSSVLIQKQLMKRYPMEHDDLHEDYAVWLQLLKNGYHAYGVNEPLIQYRISGNSKSGNKRKAAWMTYKVYRYIGLNHLQTAYYFFWYAIRNLKKYHTILKKINSMEKKDENIFY